MTTKQLENQMLTTEAFTWLQNKYLAVDSTNKEAYASFLAQDCTLQFGNNPIVVGKKDLVEGIEDFWKTIKGLNHNFINVLGNDSHISLEANIDYTRLDGKTVLTPCVTNINRDTEGLATSIKIFLDIAPVFQS